RLRARRPTAARALRRTVRRTRGRRRGNRRTAHTHSCAKRMRYRRTRRTAFIEESRMIRTFALWVCVAFAASAAADDAVVLRGATVYVDPTTAPLHDTDVVIRNGAIVAVGASAAPANAKSLDCRGLVVVAGLHNSHVHFLGPEWADAAERPADALTAAL